MSRQARPSAVLLARKKAIIGQESNYRLAQHLKERLG